MNRTNRDAFSGASPFPVVEATIIIPWCALVLAGGCTQVSWNFLNLSRGSQTILSNPDGTGLEARSLAICSALPVADPYRT